MNHCKLAKLIILAALIIMLFIMLSAVDKRKIYEEDGIQYVDDVSECFMKFLNIFGITRVKQNNEEENFQQLQNDEYYEDFQQPVDNDQNDAATETTEKSTQTNATTKMSCVGSVCGGNNDMEDAKIAEYLNEYVYNGNLTYVPDNKVSPKEFRQNYFLFGDRVNEDSNISPEGDVVDKINELYLAENTDAANGYNGYVGNEDKKVKDIFNDLTEQHNAGRIKEPSIDKVSMNAYYVQEGTGGNFMVDSLRIYENDPVENGSAFMPDENVYGYDGKGGVPMYIQ